MAVPAELPAFSPAMSLQGCASWYNGLCVYSRLGEPQLAIDTLRQAIAAGYENFPWLHNDPDLDILRDHPEFQALVAGH